MGKVPRRAAAVALLAASLVWPAPGPVAPAPEDVRGGSISFGCAAFWLFVCGGWKPVCYQLPTACYPPDLNFFR